MKQLRPLLGKTAAALGCWTLLSFPAAAMPLLGEAADFAVLGLEGGTVTINSARSIIGNVGYGKDVVSTTNQKVDTFDGAAFVHSTASFSHTAATFAPTGGILSGPTVDAKLEQANADALAASALFGSLTPTLDLGALGDGDDRVVTSTGARNVISLASLTYKEDTLELVGNPGDEFIFNVSGAFDFSASVIKLTGVSAADVVFNFLGSSTLQINVNKAESVFQGTILAPLGVVDYHNPATFIGSIIAGDITLHSDFNLTQAAMAVPEPETFLLFGLGLAMLGALGRRRGLAPTRL